MRALNFALILNIFICFPILAGDWSSSGGDEISTEFTRRAYRIIKYIETQDQNFIDVEVLKEAMASTEIMAVKDFFDPETGNKLPDTFQTLKAWTRPGLIQLKESFWNRQVYFHFLHNDLIGHEIFRAVSQYYNDSGFNLSINKLKLDEWNGNFQNDKPRILPDLTDECTVKLWGTAMKTHSRDKSIKKKSLRKASIMPNEYIKNAYDVWIIKEKTFLSGKKFIKYVIEANKNCENLQVLFGWVHVK